MKKMKVFMIPTAKDSYNATISPAMELALKEIDEAKKKGRTMCYISAVQNKLPSEVIKSLLEAGYDITYSAFEGGDWFIKAYWETPKDKDGQIFINDSYEKIKPSTLEEYTNLFA